MIGGRLKKEKEVTRTDLRKGDLVRIISGKENGKDGKILRIARKQNAVWVEQLNMFKKHTKPSQKYQNGGIVEKEGRIALSNVMIICSNCERPVRLGLNRLPDGERIRICRRCGEAMDKV